MPEMKSDRCSGIPVDEFTGIPVDELIGISVDELMCTTLNEAQAASAHHSVEHSESLTMSKTQYF